MLWRKESKKKENDVSYGKIVDTLKTSRNRTGQSENPKDFSKI